MFGKKKFLFLLRQKKAMVCVRNANSLANFGIQQRRLWPVSHGVGWSLGPGSSCVLSAVTALLSNLWIERDEHGEARSNSALRRRLIYCAVVSGVARDLFSVTLTKYPENVHV